ncbi:MAG: Asp-tRNA(Asn)/Glu-tRNA(Gln) amidotransferase subunit GatA [Minisyncoccia bacterium]
MEDTNKEIHAFLEIFKEPVRSADFSSIESNPLKGMAIAIKDNMCLEDKEATAGSKILVGFRSPYTGTAVQRLLDKGVEIVGRTNLDEFAMGSSTENSGFGPTKNPVDTTRVPGGSSGGSAAAVASGMVRVALGSDTGGSIRQPAAFCGIVGLKPTYGAVSRYGLMALAASLDQIGPFSKTVRDAELIFDAMKGKDKYDATSFYPEKTNTDFKKIIGVPKGITNGLENDVKENFENSLARMKSLGYEIKEIEMPSLPLSLAVYYIIQPAEASSNLARYDGIRYGLSVAGDSVLDEYLKTREAGFGAEVKRRIILGTYVLSSGYHDEYYGSALKAKEVIKKEFEDAFREVGAIATPTTPTPAFKFGEKTGNPVEMYLGDVFTVPANITGIPAISLPSGFVNRDGKDLPLGFQLMANNYREDVLFKMGKEFLGEALE